jgi:hypothetical protein
MVNLEEDASSSDDEEATLFAEKVNSLQGDIKKHREKLG